MTEAGRPFPREGRRLLEVLVTAYSVDVMIALEAEEQPSPAWWAERHRRGNLRAGGMPPEVADPARAQLARQTDPQTGEHFARVRLPLPPETTLARARELCHMLSSVLAAEGYTLRQGGKRIEVLPGDQVDAPAASLGGAAFTQGRVCAAGCGACVAESKVGCCSEGAAFSLADIGAALLAGEDERVAAWLALPGQRDGVKWHPYLRGGRCTFHSEASGCTLPPDRMPLQCRTYLCLPERLLPPDILAAYDSYVEALEDAEAFVEEHMHEQGGVDFDSPLADLKAAAAQAFGAWAAAGATER